MTKQAPIIFTEDFKKLSPQNFSKRSAECRRDLGDHLRTKDVYILKARNVLMDGEIVTVVQRKVLWKANDLNLTKKYA